MDFHSIFTNSRASKTLFSGSSVVSFHRTIIFMSTPFEDVASLAVMNIEHEETIKLETEVGLEGLVTKFNEV